MTTWSDGYVTEIEYEWFFFREMAPVHLNYICLLKGHRPPDLEQPFTYCELGTGLGLTSTMLAASNPTGKFWAIDVNPTHIVSAQALADEGKVKNVTFLEASFNELVHHDLPRFDYICMHGVWSWVSEGNRKSIQAFVRTHLKPGGIVYVSYNCAVGWEVIRSLGRLLRTFARMEQGSIQDRLRIAIERITELSQQEGGFFQDNAIAHEWLQRIKTYSWNYLAHEYLNEHWEAFYFEEVMHAFSEAKLTFVGASNALKNFDYYVLKENSKKQAVQIGNSLIVETLKDFDTTASLRKDIFIRGSQKWTQEQSLKVLRKQKFAMIEVMDSVEGRIQTSLGETSISNELLSPMMEALRDKPCSLEELTDLFEEEEKFNLFDILVACTVLTDARVMAPLPHTESDNEKTCTSILNRAIVNRTLQGTPIPFLSAPTICSGIPCDDLDRYCYHFVDCKNQAGEKLDGKNLFTLVFTELTKQGRQLHDMNGVLLTEEKLYTMAEDFMGKKLVIWKTLGIF